MIIARVTNAVDIIETDRKIGMSRSQIPVMMKCPDLLHILSSHIQNTYPLFINFFTSSYTSIKNIASSFIVIRN